MTTTYTLFNPQIGYQFNKHVSTTLTLNNAFNKRYYARTLGTYFGDFGDTRNVMLSIRTAF